MTVCITTYNRVELLPRAIKSVLAQSVDAEIVVMDDASTDGTAELVAVHYPTVRYMRQPENGGPGRARGRAIASASGDWVLLLDDDDWLRPDALAVVQHHLGALQAAERYPVVQFATSSGTLSGSTFVVASVADYADEVLRGDFTPIVQRRRFLEEGLKYPDLRIGGEHLLWWDVARRWGIPSWDVKIVHLGDDAPARLTSVKHQLRRAQEFGRLHDLSLETLGASMRTEHPHVFRKWMLGSATYRLLAGRPIEARARIREFGDAVPRHLATGLWGLTYFPAPWVRALFVAYRWTAAWRRLRRRAEAT